MATPKDCDLARHRRHLQRTLSRHFESPPVQWALRAVQQELFAYRPTHDHSRQLWTSDRMRHLRDAGATPLQVLQRVLECYALRREDGDVTFPNRRTWLCFLGRKVLLLKRGVLPEHSSAYRLSFLGQLIEETFGKFATAALLRMDKDQAERAAFDASCEGFIS